MIDRRNAFVWLLSRREWNRFNRKEWNRFLWCQASQNYSIWLGCSWRRLGGGAKWERHLGADLWWSLEWSGCECLLYLSWL